MRIVRTTRRFERDYKREKSKPDYSIYRHTLSNLAGLAAVYMTVC
jgi:hypothetical protein